MRILVAEDEAELSRALKAVLDHQGYETDVVGDGLAAVEMAARNSYDCMVFDIMMPVMDGLTAVREIRSTGNLTPVIMLTAKTEVDDRVGGLDAGADDYMTKPFAMKELLARIRSMTRRSTAFNPSRLTVGTLTLDIDEQELSAVHSIRLSGKEFQLMEYFMRNPGRAMMTEDLFARIWKDDPEADTEIVWLYISYLRKKLGAVMAEVTIEGERGGSFTLR
ncbi:MAG: response regulator transcription factor [Lachnospiraceae bacterium]|jgi:DNA-binding response OmpR family regulator|nr:response regulator transcription factor [Lachnospiraceae bacterium]